MYNKYQNLIMFCLLILNLITIDQLDFTNVNLNLEPQTTKEQQVKLTPFYTNSLPRLFSDNR